jgi:hypothetical protein
MPGFDGTGPMGQGPMTGGGRGFCAMPYRGYGSYGYGMGAPYYPPFSGYPSYGYGMGAPYYPPSGGYPSFGRPFYGYGPVFGAGRGGLPWGGGRGRVFGGGRGFRRWW